MPDLPRRTPTILTVVLIAVHAAWIASLWGNAYVGADAPGYFVQGRMIADERAVVLTPDSPAQYISVHWLPGGDGRYYSRYPPGFPVLISLLYDVGGPTFALIVNPVLTSLSLLFFVLIARRWTTPWAALAGAAVFASLASFNEQALLGFAHMAELAALLGALWLLDRWRDRPSWPNGLAAGLLIGALPAIRYPTALPGVALGVTALVLASRSRPHRRAVWSVIAGAAAPLLALLFYNDTVFGSPLRTGYAISQEQSAFGLYYLRVNFPRYAYRLIRDAGPAVLLGAVGMVALAMRPSTRYRGILLASLVTPITLFYMAYYSPFADSRVMLATLPLYILAATCFAGQLRPAIGQRWLGALLATHVVLFVADSLPRARKTGRFADRSELVREEIHDAVPAGSVIIAALGFETLLEYEGNWKLVDWSLLWTREPPQLRRGAPGRAESGTTLQDFVASRGAYAGPDERERMRAVLQDAFDWAGDAGVYWIGDDSWIADVRERTGTRLVLDPVTRVPRDDPQHVLARLGTKVPWWLATLPATIYRVRLQAER